jgi:hypothetical protein
MGEHSRLSLGVPIRNLEGCFIGGILFHTENVLEASSVVRCASSASSKALAKESSDLLETVLKELATESKLPW